MAKDTEFLDRLVERLDRLDPSAVQGYILRLAREKGLLETIFQTIREGVLIVDRELHIHFVNQAAKTMLGLPDDIEERENQRINRYLRELDWGRLMAEGPEMWDRAYRQEIEVFYPAHRFLQFYILPYRGEPGGEAELDLVSIVLHDVTDLHDRTESTIESEKLNAITMLAAGVAHEIGNPLNSLNIHLQLLQRHFRDHDSGEGSADARELLEVALEEVARLDAITSQFLKAVRPSPADLEPLAIEEVIGETLRFLKVEIEDRDVEVECTRSEDIPELTGDAAQLRQAFYNLIRNAVQAMPDGGKLTIGLRLKGNDVAISFRDSGVGISPEHLQSVFDPYYSTKEDGSGLGLVVVERIVREHGGTLNVESEPGEGAVFTIRLPLQDQRTRLLEYRPGDDPPTADEAAPDSA